MAGRTSYYGGIVLDGLVFHIDAAKQESYAKRGLRYMQNGNNNLFIDFADTSISPSTKNATGTIINGATFSNFAPYHLTGYYSQFWHDPVTTPWRQSAGVGTFYGNIEFDGVDDYVSFSATPDLNTTDITVSAWFYVNKFTSGGTASIVSRYNNTSLNNGWELGYNNNGVVWFGGRENSGTYISVTSSLLVKQTNMNIAGTANGGWYNAVGTKSGNQWSISVAETNCFRHVDNIAEVRKTTLKHLPSPRTVQVGTGTIPFNTNNLVLGKASDLNKYYMNGRLMNVSIYNRALSLAEINQNFDSFSKRIIDIEGIPVPLNPFDYIIVTYQYTPPLNHDYDLDTLSTFRYATGTLAGGGASTITGFIPGTGVVGCGTLASGADTGIGLGYWGTIPNGVNINSTYMLFGGDDSGQVGTGTFGESIVINFKNLDIANITTSDDIVVELFAGWHSRGDENYNDINFVNNPYPITIKFETFIGGVVSREIVGGITTNRYVTTGTSISGPQVSEPKEITPGSCGTGIQGDPNNFKQHVGSISYNLTTKVASVTFY